MKKLIIMTAILIGLSVPAVAEIEIKGFKLDMTKKEAKANWKNVRIKSKWIQNLLIPNYYMTLAGKDSPKPTMWFDKENKAEGKPLKEIAWFFCYKSNVDYGCDMQGDRHTPVSFNKIIEALKTKYPLECTDHELQNGFGAKFIDRVCMYKQGDITLMTKTYANPSVFAQEQGSIRIFRGEYYKPVETNDL
jgi:hypothetical protein